MTQKVRIDFIGDADFRGVTAEISKMKTAFASLAAAGVAGPDAIDKAMRMSTRTMAGNLNALKGVTAQTIQLSSVSETFSKRLRQSSFQFKDARSAIQGLTGRNQEFANSMARLSKEQLQFRDATMLATGKDINGRINGVAVSTERLATQANINRNAWMNSAKVIQSAGQNMVNAGKNMQWTGRQITMGVTLPLMAAGGAATFFAYQIDKQLTRIAKVYNFAGDDSADAINRLKETSVATAREIADEFGILQTETLQVTAAFAQMGFVGQQLQQMTQLTMRTSLLGEVDTEASQTLVRTLTNAFEQLDGSTSKAGRTMKTVETVLNRLNIVENETILSTSELAEELPDLAGTLNATGLSAEFGAAALTGMADQGLNVNDSQTALRTSLIRIISPTEKAVRVWKQMAGIDLDNLVQGGDTEEILRKISSAVASAGDDYTRTSLMSALVGNRQAGRISQLLAQINDYVNGIDNGFAKAARTLGIFGETGVSELEAFQQSQKELEAQTQSMAGQIDRAKASLAATAAAMGNSLLPKVNNFLDAIQWLIDSFRKLPDGFKALLGWGAALVAALGPVLMLSGVLRQVVGNVIKGFGGVAIKALQRFGVSSEFAANMQDRLNQQLMSGRQVTQQQTAAVEGLVASMRQMQQLNENQVYTDDYLVQNTMSGAGSTELTRIKETEAVLQQQLKVERSITDEKRKAAKVEQEKLAVKDKALAQLERERTAQQSVVVAAQAGLDAARRKVTTEQNFIKNQQESLRLRQQELSRLAGAGFRRGTPENDNKRLQIARINETIRKSELQLADAKTKVTAATRELQVAEQQSAALGPKIGGAKNSQTAATKKLAAATAELTAAQTAQDATQSKALALGNQKVALRQRMVGAIRQQSAAEKTLTVDTQQGMAVNKQALNGMNGRMAAIKQSALGIGLASAAIGTAMRGMDSDFAQAFGRSAQGVGTMATSMAIMPGPLGIIVGLAGVLAENTDLLVAGWKKLSGQIKDTSEYAEGFAESMTLQWNEVGVMDLNGETIKTRQALQREMYEQNSEFIDTLKQADADRQRAMVQNFAIDLQQAGNSAEDIRDYVQTLLDTAEINAEVDELVIDVTKVDEFAEALEQRLKIAFEGGNKDLLSAEVDNFIGSISNNQFDVAGATFEALISSYGDSFDNVMQHIKETNREAYDEMKRDGIDSFEDMRTKMNEREDYGFVGNLLGGWMDTLEDDLIPELAAVEHAGEAMIEQLAQMAPGFEEDVRAANSFSEAVGVLIEKELLGEEALQEYQKAMNTGRTAIGLSGEALYQFAASSAFSAAEVQDLTVNSEDAADAVEELGERAEQAAQRGKAFVSNLQSEMKEIQQGLLDTILNTYDDEVDRRMDSFDRQADYMKQRQDNENDAMKDAHDEQREVFDDTYDARRDRMEDDFDRRVELIEAASEAEVEALESQDEAQQEAAEQRIEAIEAQDEAQQAAADRRIEALEAQDEAQQAAADRRIEALEAQDEAQQAAADEQLTAIDEVEQAEEGLEAQRERVFEAEKRRRDFLSGQRNSAVSFVVALAEGDVDAAARLRSEMQAAESDYNSSIAQAAQEQAKEAKEAARAAEREAIEAAAEQRSEALQQEIDQTGESAEAASKRLKEEMDRTKNAADVASEGLKSRIAVIKEATSAESERIKLRIEGIKEATSVELDSVKRTKDATLEALAAERVARQEAMAERQEIEQEALAASNEREREHLEARKNTYKESAAAQRDAMKEMLDEQMRAIAKTEEELVAWKDNVIALVDVEVEGSLGSEIVRQADLYGGALHDKFMDGINQAKKDIQEQEQWDLMGEVVGESFSRGMLGDQSLADILSEIGKAKDHSPSTQITGGPSAYHSGGPISGGVRPQGWKPDERMIRAQDGEYMIQRTAVQRIGRGVLDRINNVGRGGEYEPGTFHAGGLVGGIANMAAQAGTAALGYIGLNLAKLRPETVQGIDEQFGKILGSTSSAVGGFDMPDLSDEQDSIAATIWNVGQRAGASAKQMMAGFMAAFVESQMQNLDYGHLDSLGVFQQRPSQGWGSAQQIQQPTFAAESFFLGRTTNPGALAVSQAGTAGNIAQRVQRSAFPTRYDENFGRAQSVMDFIASVGGGILQGGGMAGGPFSGLFGFGGNGLTPPDEFAPWLTENQRRVNPAVLSVVGSVLSTVAGRQEIMSGYRPGSIVLGTDRLSNHSKGHATDITALSMSYPGGTPEQDAMGDEIAAKFRALPSKFGVSEVLWKTMTGGNHYNHVHVGFRDGVPGAPTGPAPVSMPQLDVGGKVRYDNTIANLHRSETVLTAPLTQQLEQGIARMADGATGGNVFHVYAGPGMSVDDLARKVAMRTERTQIKRGVKVHAV